MPGSKHISLLFHRENNSTISTQIIDILCYILFILGLIGNILGLFIFSSSRRTWRISSTYVYLATTSSITNVLCIIRYVSVLHSGLRNLLYDLVGRSWWACKIYELSFLCRVISSWITLFWMFERLMCVSRGLRTFFNQCNSYKLKLILTILIFTTIFCWIIGPSVYMYEPVRLNEELIDSTIDKNKTYCELHRKASEQWKKYFHEIHFGLNNFTIRCVFSELIPTAAIILFNSYIIYHVIRLHRRLQQTTKQRESSRTRLWMNIVLLLHSSLFLASIASHLIGHYMGIEAHEAWWVLLAVLINSSLNFYIYCLSGKAFRNEIRLFFNQLKMKVYQKFNNQQRWVRNQRLNNQIDQYQVRIPLKTYRMPNYN